MVLENIHKGVKNTDKAIEFTKNARKAGLLVHGCFMVGNPGDTPETLRMTLDYAKKLNPNTAQFYPIMAYPGTEAYKEALASGALQTKDYNQWLDKDGFHRTTIQRGELTSQALVLPRLIKSPYKTCFQNIPYFMRVRKRFDAKKIRKIG